MTLGDHGLRLVLVHPQIAPNTGNVARLCVATGTALHLVRPLGFVLDDRQLKRSAMDYWPRLHLTVHDDEEALLRSIEASGGEPWLFTSKGNVPLWEARMRRGDWLLFGSEAAGLPQSLRQRYPSRHIQIPQVAAERCLNLSTAAGIGLYEGLRQVTLAP
jgi:tRNA (cytidine/uridine-2'-O-)-methyltransferase